MSDSTGDIHLIGSTFPPGEFSKYLEERDPCFGRLFVKGSPECKECLAPVVVEERLYLLQEVCHARKVGAVSPGQLQPMTTQTLVEHLAAGTPIEELFQSVLGDGVPEVLGSAAREILANRLHYLRTKGLPTPTLPALKELKKHV